LAPHLIALCGLIYLGVAFEKARARDWPMALAFFAYALANVGFVWQALGGRSWRVLLPW